MGAALGAGCIVASMAAAPPATALPAVSASDARALALSKVPGTVQSVVRKARDGFKAWAVRIERSDGSIVVGYVDMRSGTVFDWTVQRRPRAPIVDLDGRGDGSRDAAPLPPRVGEPIPPEPRPPVTPAGTTTATPAPAPSGPRGTGASVDDDHQDPDHDRDDAGAGGSAHDDTPGRPHDNDNDHDSDADSDADSDSDSDSHHDGDGDDHGLRGSEEAKSYDEARESTRELG